MNSEDLSGIKWVIKYLKDRIIDYHYYEEGQQWPDETIQYLIDELEEQLEMYSKGINKDGR